MTDAALNIYATHVLSRVGEDDASGKGLTLLLLMYGAGIRTSKMWREQKDAHGGASCSVKSVFYESTDKRPRGSGVQTLILSLLG